MFRNALARGLWGCTDLLQIVQGGLIQLASKVVRKEPAWVDLVEHYTRIEKTW